MARDVFKGMKAGEKDAGQAGWGREGWHWGKETRGRQPDYRGGDRLSRRGSGGGAHAVCTERGSGTPCDRSRAPPPACSPAAPEPVQQGCTWALVLVCPAAVTKRHRSGTQEQQELNFLSSGGWKPGIKAPAGLRAGEDRFLAPRRWLLAVPPSRCRPRWALFYEGTDPTWGLHPHDPRSPEAHLLTPRPWGTGLRMSPWRHTQPGHSSDAVQTILRAHLAGRHPQCLGTSMACGYFISKHGEGMS